VAAPLTAVRAAVRALDRAQAQYEAAIQDAWAAGETQAAIAEAAGISPPMVRKIIHGYVSRDR
jgi:DNA-binding CsgD family transcriptional regulator